MPSANVSICVRIGRDEIFPTFILSSNPNSDRRDHDEKNVQRAPWLESLLRRRISHELHPIADLIRLEISPVSSEKSSGVSAEYCRSKLVHLLAFPWADSYCDISRSIDRLRLMICLSLTFTENTSDPACLACVTGGDSTFTRC